jgi:hypothetical protein
VESGTDILLIQVSTLEIRTDVCGSRYTCTERSIPWKMHSVDVVAVNCKQQRMLLLCIIISKAKA